MNQLHLDIFIDFYKKHKLFVIFILLYILYIQIFLIRYYYKNPNANIIYYNKKFNYNNICSISSTNDIKIKSDGTKYIIYR